MGCCFSRSGGPNSPFPGGVPNASARHIIQPPLSLPESEQAHLHASPQRSRRSQRPLDEHINKPLRRHKWASADRRWTREQLESERIAFFDTRVTGRPEIWQTIRAAVNVMGSGDWGEPRQEHSDSLATAQSILSAAEISLPTGDLSDGVYDSFGNYYQLPQWVVSDPINVATTNSVDDGEEGSVSGDDGTVNDEEDARKSSNSMNAQGLEKGKGVSDARDQVTVRARLSETGRDFDISASRSESTRSIIKKLASQTSLPPEKKIKIAYMGKILRENQSLEVQGWQIGHVVNALVFNR